VPSPSGTIMASTPRRRGILHAQGRVVVNHFPAVSHGFVGEGIAVIGGTKNCATTGQNAADGFFREFLGALGPDESIKAVADADDALAMAVDGRANNGANDRVYARSIAATVDDPDCAHRFHICTVTESVDKFNELHELDDVTQDPREEVESEGDSE
jgi:hypothetical protein